MSRFYHIDVPRVVHEIIDNEVIVIDFSAGTYYHIEGCGAYIWSMIENGVEHQSILSNIAAYYSSPVEIVADAIEAFLHTLVDEGLIVESDKQTGKASNIDLPADKPVVFIPPAIHKFTDLQQLLLLDPIHEVDETSGWPNQKEAK